MNMPTKSLRIVIADDHTLTRNSLKLALKQASSFDVVGDAENGNSVIDMCLSQHPDVVLMDIGMPVKDGIERFCLEDCALVVGVRVQLHAVELQCHIQAFRWAMT